MPLMLYSLARVLQIIGLILVPLAIAGNLAELANAHNRLTLWESLALSGVGVLLFTIGWLIQQRVKPG